MAQLIIEVQDHSRGHRTYYPVADFPVTIGRGYGNNIILSDPHVCAEHLIVSKNENGGWLVKDLESMNGIQRHAEQQTNQDPIHLASGDYLVVGKTRLRFVSPEHPIEPAKVLHGKASFIAALRSLAIVWSLLTLLVSGYAMNEYLASSVEVHIEKLIADSLAVVGGVLIWSSLWALLAFIVQRKLNFHYLLAVSIVYVLFDTLLSNVIDYVAFNANSILVAEVLSYITAGVLLAGLFYASMRKCLMVSKKKNLLLANVFSWGVVVVIGFVVYANQSEFRQDPEYPAEIKPPFGRLAATQTLDEFLIETDRKFTNK